MQPTRHARHFASVGEGGDARVGGHLGRVRGVRVPGEVAVHVVEVGRARAVDQEEPGVAERRAVVPRVVGRGAGRVLAGEAAARLHQRGPGVVTSWK